MELIKNIKYNEDEDYYCQTSGPSSANAEHGYRHRYGYASGADTYDDVNMPNSPSNDSVASSAEDIEAILRGSPEDFN